MKNTIDFKAIRQILFLIILSLIFLTTANAAGVSLSATPPENTVNVGQTATYTIKINRDGFTDKVTLSATGLPSGATANFAPNTTTAGSSVLTVKTLTTTPVGTFIINVKATANGISIAPITVKLITKTQSAVSVSVNPTTQSIIAGQSTFYDIAIKRTNYEGAVKLTAENLPSGITVQFEPQTTTGSTSRMYLYSNGLPFLQNQFSMVVRARGIADTVENWTAFYAVVNCGINWTEQLGTPDNQTLIPDFATDITFDSLGNVYAAGYNYQPSTDDTDAWVAKFDKFGAKLWTRTITTLTKDRATNVFVDSAGNVYMAGITEITQSNFVNHNIFVAKFDANGNQNPNIITPGTNHEEGEVMQFGINSSGNVTLTAATQVSRVGIGMDVNGERRESVDFDITRFVFDANLNILGNSSQPIINNAVGNPKDLKIGADGSIYVLKEDLSQIDMRGFKDVRVSVEKFNAPNNQNWHSVWLDLTPNRDFQNTTASRLAIDATGNVFAIGNIHEPEISSSAGPFQAPRPVGFYSWFVAFNPNSTIRWQKEIAYGESGTEISALDVDAQGNIFYGGYTFGTLSGNNSNQNGSDAFFAKISGQNGNNMFLRQFNVANKDGFNALKIGGNGEILFAGYTVLFKNVNYGFEDALVMKYSVITCFF